MVTDMTMTPRMMRTMVMQGNYYDYGDAVGVEDDGHTCDLALRIRVDTVLITYTLPCKMFWLIRHVTVTDMSQHVVAVADGEERDRLFETVRDGDLAEAKAALAKVNMSELHSSLKQNALFFVAARRRRGCVLLAKLCIREGVDVEQVDTNQQTALFWAAAYGNLAMVEFLLNFGFEA
eukprot:s813_g9.t1